MAEIIKWPVVLVAPGEDELPLLAELSTRRDARIVAVLDPTGASIGAGLAEIMGLPVLTSLAELTPGSARWLVHPPLNDLIAALVDQAEAAGLVPALARNFADQISGPRLAAAPLPASEADLEDALAKLTRAGAGVRVGQGVIDHEFLERETTAIHRTLSRIEEALDREALLRWLLGLATRATGATSGSIMLLDESADELYIAFAYGLGQGTLHRTRVRLGEAIAGRVARTRQAELIVGPKQPLAGRDRVDLESAVSAPILWDGRVLGVVNVCTAAGEAPLVEEAVGTLESLTHRFGLILDRFVHIQSSGDRLLLREIEERFTRDTGLPETLASTLCAWAADIRDVSGAAQASLDILTSDGDLFCATPEGTAYEAPPSELKAEILSRGRPRVLRPGDARPASAGDPDADESTVFHLPVGRDPLRALLTLVFSSAARAHHFHAVSGEILLLLNRHLTGFLDRAATADQLDRLTTLAAALSELGSAPPGPATSERVLAAARRLTGAGEALLLTGEEMLAPAPTEAETPAEALRREAARLLNDAGRGGWQTTVLEAAHDGQTATRSLLAVPLGGSDAFPGLVLLDKRRLHPLDGSSFTEFDALFARRLLPLLAERLRRLPELDAEAAAALADKLTPAARDLEATVIAAAATRGALADILRREMDRCDRYHTMLGLAAFRPAERDAARGDPTELVSEIERHLRSSDHISCLEDGTVLVIVPEDIQSLPRLIKRVCDLMRRLAANPVLDVRSASRVYPGGGDSPERLLQAVLTALA